MRQRETTGVRLDERKTMGSNASVRSIGCFGRLRRARCAIALAEEAQKNEPDLEFIRNPGNVGRNRWERPMKRALMIAAMAAFCLSSPAFAETEENAEDFMQIHKIEITFHQACTSKNLDLMMALCSDDPTLHSAGH